MTNSYLMIGPDGRFFWHVPQGPERALEYGTPILQVGVDEALREVRFSEISHKATAVLRGRKVLKVPRRGVAALAEAVQDRCRGVR